MQSKHSTSEQHPQCLENWIKCGPYPGFRSEKLRTITDSREQQTQRAWVFYPEYGTIPPHSQLRENTAGVGWTEFQQGLSKGPSSKVLPSFLCVTVHEGNRSLSSWENKPLQGFSSLQMSGTLKISSLTSMKTWKLFIRCSVPLLQVRETSTLHWYQGPRGLWGFRQLWLHFRSQISATWGVTLSLTTGTSFTSRTLWGTLFRLIQTKALAHTQKHIWFRRQYGCLAWNNTHSLALYNL